MNERTTNETVVRLQANLKAVKTIHLSIVLIFVVILGAWLVSGGWRTQPLLFIATVAMSISIVAMLQASRSGLTKQLAQCRAEKEPASP